MSASYQAKGNLQRLAQLKALELILPFTITSNATPASKTESNDHPGVLSLKLEGAGQDYTTVANGGFDTSAEAAAITFATSTDATGIFSVCIRIGETIGKVIAVQCIKTTTSAGGAAELLNGTTPTGATAYVTSLGDKVVADFDSAVNFATTNFAGFIRVVYTPVIG